MYADSDSLEREISELYSFTELPEFELNHQVSRPIVAPGCHAYRPGAGPRRAAGRHPYLLILVGMVDRPGILPSWCTRMWLSLCWLKRNYAIGSRIKCSLLP